MQCLWGISRFGARSSRLPHHCLWPRYCCFTKQNIVSDFFLSLFSVVANLYDCKAANSGSQACIRVYLNLFHSQWRPERPGPACGDGSSPVLCSIHASWALCPGLKQKDGLYSRHHICPRKTPVLRRESFPLPSPNSLPF